MSVSIHMNDHAQGNRWGEYILLGLVTLLAAALRFYHLGEWSYFVDELHTWHDTTHHYTRPLISLLYPGSRQAFWLLTKLSLDTFGTHAISLRLVPSIFGILTIPLVYFPFRALFDRRIAMLTVFLLAISQWHIYMSQMARWYTLEVLFVYFALISLYIFIERNSFRYFLGYLILSYIALTIHLTGGFAFIIGFMYLALLLIIPKIRPENFDTRKIVSFLCIPVLLSPVLLGWFFRFLEEWEASKELHGAFGGDFFIKVLYQMTPSIGVMALVGLALLLKSKDRKGVFFSVYCLFPFVALNVFPIFELSVGTRYMLFTLPGILVLTSYLCIYVMDNLTSNKRIITAAVILAGVLPIMQTDYMYFTSYHGNRDRLREAVRFVKEKRKDDDLFFPYFVHGPKDGFKFEKTAALEGLEIKHGRMITSRSVDALDVSKRVWIVTRIVMRADGSGLGEWIAENTHLLAEFPADFGPQDYTIRVYLYSPDPVQEMVEALGEKDPALVAAPLEPKETGEAGGEAVPLRDVPDRRRRDADRQQG